MPKATPEAKEATRRRLLEAAARGFRTQGYGGVGVDALAGDAGVTSGAFYAHFGSKAAAFRAALDAGLDDLQRGIVRFRDTHGERWLKRFAGWYLSADRRGDLAGSCALPTLTFEVARADDATRDAYDDALRPILGDVEAGLGGRGRREKAITILALLAGGMSMGHAVRDPTLSDDIARAVERAIAQISASG